MAFSAIFAIVGPYPKISTAMTAINKKDPFLLFFGDVVIFFASLWLMLLARYQAVPDRALLVDHALPFSILFFAWLLVFYIAGLYEKRTIILKNSLPNTILRAQITNCALAVLFFYLIPYFGITPKTNLFIYLAISSLLILLWRIYGYAMLGPKTTQNVILIASGQEMKDLYEEVNTHPHYNFRFVASVNLDEFSQVDAKEKIMKEIVSNNVSIVAIDFKNEKAAPILPFLYSMILSNVVFIDMHSIYEDVFDRIPLSLIEYSWFFENISFTPKASYDVLKRIMDIVISAPLLVISLITYPFIFLAIILERSGRIFFKQERVGENGKKISIVKFRSMVEKQGIDHTQDSVARVTKVGEFLRKTRLDEIPQLWNVLIGDVSLIGPRPELPRLVELYEKEIPYYGIRHLIKPGLSGWAQIYHDNHPHHGQAVAETKEKLSYDLYYIKNRSFMLDIKIALRTVKKLLSIAGI